MTELTPEAVSKHAEAHPIDLGGAPWGVWRYASLDGFMPALHGVRLTVDGNVLVRCAGSPLPAWLVYWDEDWPGTWTPVRPDGGDLPGAEVDELRRLLSWYEARWQEAKDLLGITGPKMGPQDVLGQIECLLESVVESESALTAEYERGRADGSAKAREELIEAKRKAGEQAIRLAALEEGWHDLRARHGGCAGWIRKIEGERDVAYERGRADELQRWHDGVEVMESMQGLIKAAEERARAAELAAIVAGVEGLKAKAEADLEHCDDRDNDAKVGLGAEIDGYDNVLAALANGEWSAKP